MILGIIQARLSSTRLPGKVLKEILGKPMLQLQIERVLRAKKLDKLIVATSTLVDDDKIESFCKTIGVDCFRGSLNDVLDRYYHAAQAFKADHIVRLTADCPLHDSKVIDGIIDFYQKGKYDFACNTIKETFPDGQDVWIFSFRVLEQTWKNAKLLSDREHVCTYMINHPELFKQGSFLRNEDLSSLRWTVDENDDINLITMIYTDLYKTNPEFETEDILKLIEKKPELNMINNTIDRDEGLKKSLLADRQRIIMVKGLDISKSLEMQKRAKSRIPGLSQLLSKRVDQFSEGVWPGYYSKAKGVEVWDLDENQYIDMSIGGIGATVLGYSDHDVDEAVISVIKKGVSSSLNCPEEVELAELLCEIHPWAEKVRFTRSGGESMAAAVRIARAYSRKDKIAFCGYHGWHDWYLSANIGTKNTLGEHLLPGLEPLGVPQGLQGNMIPFRYNKIEELEKIATQYKNDIGVIVMEPIRNDSPQPGFIEGVRRIADEIGAVLIIDEITAAFRMNNGGAHLSINLKPDIAVFAKAIGNGYAIGAIIGKGHIMNAAELTFISSTNWTERIGPTAALATIKKFRMLNAHTHLMKCGRLVQEGWAASATKNGLKLHIGGIPPLSHFTFESPKHLSLKALFIQEMLEKGFLASTLFYAMYAHQSWHINTYLKAVDETFGVIAEAVNTDSIEKRLKGKPANPGFKRLN